MPTAPSTIRHCAATSWASSREIWSVDPRRDSASSAASSGYAPATCRTAASDCTLMNSLYASTAEVAFAVSATCQTTMAAISTGFPVEIAAIVGWQVADTAKATSAVEAYSEFIRVQSEAAVRHVAGAYPYDAAA